MKLKPFALCALLLGIFGCAEHNNSNLQNFVQTVPLADNLGNSPEPPSDIAFPIAEDGLPDTDFIDENERMENPLSVTQTSNISGTKSLQSTAPKPLLLAVSSTTDPRPEPSESSNYISVMGQNGRVITVWALARRNWLWAYASIESQDFGTIRNWKLEPSFSREHFRFINQRLGTCIEAFRNGLIHNGCDSKNLAQDFELLPSNTGSVFIRSIALDKCVTYNPVSSTNYSTITLETCTDKISPLKDQNWYIAPPILKATPQN